MASSEPTTSAPIRGICTTCNVQYIYGSLNSKCENCSIKAYYRQCTVNELRGMFSLTTLIKCTALLHPAIEQALLTSSAERSYDVIGRMDNYKNKMIKEILGFLGYTTLRYISKFCRQQSFTKFRSKFEESIASSDRGSSPTEAGRHTVQLLEGGFLNEGSTNLARFVDEFRADLFAPYAPVIDRGLNIFGLGFFRQ